MELASCRDCPAKVPGLRPEQKPGSPEIIDSLKLAEAAPQAQSPLFGKLPAEVRFEIYGYLFLPFNSALHAYPTDSFVCQPGHTGPQRTHVQLLYTCRRACLEARFIPLHETELEFWEMRLFPLSPAGPDSAQHSTPAAPPYARLYPQSSWLATCGLTAWHLRHARRAHFFTAQWLLPFCPLTQTLPLFCTSTGSGEEGSGEDGGGGGGGGGYPLFQPRTITVSACYSSWTWYWVRRMELPKPPWERLMLDARGWPASLRELRLRLESTNCFRRAIKTALRRIVQCEVALGGGGGGGTGGEEEGGEEGQTAVCGTLAVAEETRKRGGECMEWTWWPRKDDARLPSVLQVNPGNSEVISRFASDKPARYIRAELVWDKFKQIPDSS